MRTSETGQRTGGTTDAPARGRAQQRLWPRWALFRFGFRQTRKSAVIIGLVAGAMLALQGVAYQKAYPGTAQQLQFAVSLASAPGLGFLYGNPNDLYDGTPGYMVYRVLGFMGVVTAVWALTAITKLLRGAEEDGRFEVIRAGVTTPRRATALLVTGFAASWWVALLISYGLTLVAVHAGGIAATGTTMWLLNLAIFIPALLFGGAGVLTSQLGLTRGRALLYGLVPLAVLFLARGVANSVGSWHWLTYWTPFGWMQLIDPLHGPDRVWLYVPVALAIGLAAWGVQAALRDYGESLIRASTTVRSRFELLRRPWELAIRQNAWVTFGWAAGALLMIGLISGLAKVAVSALKDGGGLSRAVNRLGGTGNLEVAFLGAGVLFMVMLLLIMSIGIIGQIRRDEARQYLDNILVGPERRTTWLMQRLLLGFGTVLVISLLAGLLLLAIAALQHITLDAGKVLATSICVAGSAGFLLGLGGLLYGLAPRLAVLALYAVIGWSFLITLIASSAHLNAVLTHSTLFYYTNFNLAQWPDWATFFWLMLLGVVFSTTGMGAFGRRDVVPE